MSKPIKQEEPSNSNFHRANEIFQKAQNNLQDIHKHIDLYKSESDEFKKEEIMIRIRNLIQLQEVLIQSHTRLTLLESKIYNLESALSLVSIKSIGERKYF